MDDILLRLLGSDSPKQEPEIAVKIKVREFATGTDKDRSTFCNVRKYTTDPNWFNTIGMMY